MKIFTNQKIKTLFVNIFLSIFIFTVISILFAVFKVNNAIFYIIIYFICMSSIILMFCYKYFKQQHKILEKAIFQIREYISGNRDAIVECNDDGELYILFHEVNSLVSILNAHIENEKNANKFLNNTISDISHQLKTSLTALNIYNGIIQHEAKDFPTIQEFNQFSEKELDHIETLVKNLLKITKFDANMIVLEKSFENIFDIAEDVKKYFLFRAKQEEKKIILLGDKSITFLCDRNWIIEAINNIVKNALDHTEKGDFIQIEWQALASIIQITVKDNGSGIHPEDLYHIFKRFYRSRFSNDTQGIGLGLCLTKAIVEIHNGTIEVNSTLGVGTSFKMNFLIPTKL